MTDPSDACGRRTFLPVLSTCHQQTCGQQIQRPLPTFAARRYGKVRYTLQTFCPFVCSSHSLCTRSKWLDISINFHRLITHVDGSRVVSIVIMRLCIILCVCTIKPKRLKLKLPKLPNPRRPHNLFPFICRKSSSVFAVWRFTWLPDMCFHYTGLQKEAAIDPAN